MRLDVKPVRLDAVTSWCGAKSVFPTPRPHGDWRLPGHVPGCPRAGNRPVAAAGAQRHRGQTKSVRPPAAAVPAVDRTEDADCARPFELSARRPARAAGADAAQLRLDQLVGPARRLRCRHMQHSRPVRATAGTSHRGRETGRPVSGQPCGSRKPPRTMLSQHVTKSILDHAVGEPPPRMVLHKRHTELERPVRRAPRPHQSGIEALAAMTDEGSVRGPAVKGARRKPALELARDTVLAPAMRYRCRRGHRLNDCLAAGADQEPDALSQATTTVSGPAGLRRRVRGRSSDTSRNADSAALVLILGFDAISPRRQYLVPPTQRACGAQTTADRVRR